MMKKPFSISTTQTISAAALVLVSGVSIFSPLAASAAFGDRITRVEEAKANVTDQFCTKLSERSSDILAKINARIDKRDGLQDSRVQKLSEKRTSWDKQRTENRNERESARGQRYDTLQNKANTDAEKEAVATFEKSIEAAVSTREAAVDAAVAKYRKGIDASLGDHQGDVDAVLSAFQKSVASAFSKATSSCGNGTDIKTVRATLKAELKQARTDLKADYQNIDRVKDTRPALKATRDKEVKTALDTFKIAVEEARQALRKAFGEK
ncbi:MAG: hypothetical protein ACEQSB_04160 [Undibacterium sp.]